jgi:hypothetical protein
MIQELELIDNKQDQTQRELANISSQFTNDLNQTKQLLMDDFSNKLKEQSTFIKKAFRAQTEAK